VGEPLKRNVRRFSSDETIEKLGMENEDDGPMNLIESTDPSTEEEPRKEIT